MKLKTNLHFHTDDDPQDRLNYSFYEGVDRAAKLGFEVVALTCHNKFVFKKEYSEYAARKNILLVPGIEKTIEKRHVVILNPPDKTVEKINAFENLSEYRKDHPEIFVIAPHPYFYGNFSIKERFHELHGLFDAVEYSWFYSKFFDRNKIALAAAKKYDLPFISTSDTHDLNFLDTSYAAIDAKAKTAPAILEAIRRGNFENVTSERSFLFEMAPFIAKIELNALIKKPTKGGELEFQP